MRSIHERIEGILKLEMMTWDKFRMAQRFLQKANAIHPEDEHESILRNEALAMQDVYYDCYMSSFSREDLLKRLANVIEGKFEMPGASRTTPSKDLTCCATDFSYHRPHASP